MTDGQVQPTNGPTHPEQAHPMDEHTIAEVERAGTQFNAVTAMTVDRADALTAESIRRRDSGQPPRRRSWTDSKQRGRSRSRRRTARNIPTESSATNPPSAA
ncbi:hypothetical protein [Brevibacterium pigmentatum]|uniref:hypothetical protein n=1 Tax=Brevibacterium pigmentatum TaxID=1496080 RepID=UPI00141ED5D2|nr:hypothetical protein [Brevibacterium pigmentatum]